MRLSRRQFCCQSVLGLSALSLSQWPLPVLASTDEDHFYLQIVVDGGWDASYLFDARPLKMTQENLIQNYNGTEPIPYTGKNGTATLAAESAKKLIPLKDYFSVVNGVLMATAFEGHGQNMNFLFSGNPFGGASFIPMINENSPMVPTPITGIQTGFLFVEVNNHNSIIPLAGGAGDKIVAELNRTPKIDLNKNIFRFIENRYKANNIGKGKFSQSNEALLHSLQKQKTLGDKLINIDFANSGNDDAGTIDLLNNLFKNKVARVALMPLVIEDHFADVHSPTDAMKQSEYYRAITDRLFNIINLLRKTQYDNKRSLYDVTTFMVCSEFGRTMRQHGLKMNETGTDHNPLHNSFIIGGKKIKGGQVVGTTDFQSSDEKLSPAHLELDKNKIKIMGSPFDFKTMKPSGLLPNQFDVDQYLSMPNITNTIMSIFGVDPSKYWTTGRLKPAAPIISGIVS